MRHRPRSLAAASRHMEVGSITRGSSSCGCALHRGRRQRVRPAWGHPLEGRARPLHALPSIVTAPLRRGGPLHREVALRQLRPRRLHWPFFGQTFLDKLAGWLLRPVLAVQPVDVRARAV